MIVGGLASHGASAACLVGGPQARDVNLVPSFGGLEDAHARRKQCDCQIAVH